VLARLVLPVIVHSGAIAVGQVTAPTVVQVLDSAVAVGRVAGRGRRSVLDGEKSALGVFVGAGAELAFGMQSCQSLQRVRDVVSLR
jgi:hypothetical protein